MRTIAAVTGGRWDWSLLLPVIGALKAQSDVRVILYTTGGHGSEKFGKSTAAIEQSGWQINAVIPCPDGDTPVAVAQAMGGITAEVGKQLSQDRPDLLLLIGDRFEIHAAGVAAVPLGIPIAHVHGGDVTLGSIDEQYRPSLTKLAALHFPTTPDAAARIIQMGEEPWRVNTVGAPALDGIQATPRLTRSELEQRYGINLAPPVVLVAIHPVTTSPEETNALVAATMGALTHFPNLRVVFSYPNSDPGHERIISAIEECVRQRPGTSRVKSFGAQGFWSLFACVNAFVGNSSSGIIEAASFQLPVVNIGTRQDGRVRAANVIDVAATVDAVVAGIKRALSADFRTALRDLTNPYGDGHAGQRIASALSRVDLKRLLPKRFYEQPKPS